MSVARRTAVSHPESENKSGIQHSAPVGLRVVNALPWEVKKSVLKAIESAVSEARKAVGAVAANENGQLIMFEEETDDEIQIPPELVDAFIDSAGGKLESRNIRLEKSGDKIRIVKGYEDNAATDQGH